MCFPCFNLARDKEPRRLEVDANSHATNESKLKLCDGSNAESEPSNSFSSGSECEAVLLDYCLSEALPIALRYAQRVKQEGYGVSGDGVLEFVHSVGNSLFIDLTKNKRTVYMKRGGNNACKE